MVPAMDREASTPRRRNRIALGTVILLGASHLGCAEIKSQIFGNSKIGEIGHVDETNDIYSRNSQPRVLMPGQTVSEIPGTIVTEIQEAGPSMLPAAAMPTNPVNLDGVVLQSPRPIENNSNVRLTSTNAGVPNASRILAGSERPPEIKPATIVAQARAALDAMTTYEVSMHRQERVNGTLLPEEDVVVAIRRSPRAVRLTWPSGPNQGREALYRANEPGGQMHIKLANPSLPRLSFDPESPIVMKNSRHPVTEAGFDSLVEGLENGVNASALTYAGIETPAGLNRPAHCLTRVTPNGERWRVYLDVENHLPSLVLAVDARGALQEHYLFLDIKANPPELACAEAFDPAARWGQPKGLLSRLTRTSTESELPTTADPTPR
jgi:hypothetical protein